MHRCPFIHTTPSQAEPGHLADKQPVNLVGNHFPAGNHLPTLRSDFPPQRQNLVLVTSYRGVSTKHEVATCTGEAGEEGWEELVLQGCVVCRARAQGDPCMWHHPHTVLYCLTN